VATRIYLPSSGSAAVTPSTWNFANQINPLTFAGSRTKTASALTTKLEATGTTNPTARAMLRYVIGPLEGQSITGTVKGQMLALESNAGANASLALAVKIIQPDGTDRAVLLAQTAGDSAAGGVELATGSLTNARFLNASEANPTLTTQSATRGDYLVIEIGFRSATGTTRNISLRYGDTGSTDLTDGNTSETTDNVPWIEFSDDITFIDRLPGVGAAVLSGLAPALVFGLSMGLGALSLGGTNTQVAFQGADTGALTLAGQAPTVTASEGVSIPVPVGALALAGQAPVAQHVIPIPAGALTLSGQAPTLSVEAGVLLAVPSGSLTLAGTNVQVAFTGAETGALTLTGQAPTLSVSTLTNIAVPLGALTLAGQTPALDIVTGGGVTRDIPVGALTLAGTNVQVAFTGAGTGALTLTGNAPTLEVETTGAITVPVGALTLTGTAVSVAFIDPPPGTLVLTGQAPVANVGDAGDTHPLGTLTLAGQTPVVLTDAGVPVGALTLTAQTPVVTIDTGRAVPESVLVLAGLEPVAKIGIGRAVPVGSLVLSGVAPVSTDAATIAVPAGALTLNGQTPGLNGNIVLAPLTATLVLTGETPFRIGAVTPPLGTLVLTGQAATVTIGSAFNPAWVDANEVVSYFGDAE
jgi:hypothetical protein